MCSLLHLSTAVLCFIDFCIARSRYDLTCMYSYVWFARTETYLQAKVNKLICPRSKSGIHAPNSCIRELSFLKPGTGVEEFSERHQIFLPRFIGVSNILEKIVRYLMGCEIFGIYFRLK